MWDKELALALKEKNNKARRGAIETTIGQAGTVKSTSPLKIATSDLVLYEAEDIMLGKIFDLYEQKDIHFQVGDELAVIPLGNKETIFVIDYIR